MILHLLDPASESLLDAFSKLYCDFPEVGLLSEKVRQLCLDLLGSDLDLRLFVR